MKRRRRGLRLKVKLTENVTSKMASLNLKLKGAAVDAALLEAADYLAGIARRRAPRKSGTLQAGIYTVNSYRDNRPNLRVVKRLKYPPKPGTAIVVAGTFYQRWVEGGRKARAADPTRAVKHERRGVGRLPRRPFFRPSMRAGMPGARAIVSKRLQRIIDESSKEP